MTGYLMESHREGDRLVAQAEMDSVLPRLLATGLSEGMRVLDAGCGPGRVTRAIGEQVGSKGQVIGIDISATRIAQARAINADVGHLTFEERNICDTRLATESMDYSFSQFVFEYLAAPGAALEELVRVTRRGGKVVVSDIDGVGLFNWPCSSRLEQGIQRFLHALAQARFDIHIGRKMFHFFKQAGLANLRVHLFPFYVVAGAAPKSLIADWELRFQTLRPIAAPAFGGAPLYQEFVDDYLGMLRQEDALKYSVVLVTEGTRL